MAAVADEGGRSTAMHDKHGHRFMLGICLHACMFMNYHETVYNGSGRQDGMVYTIHGSQDVMIRAVK